MGRARAVVGVVVGWASFAAGGPKGLAVEPPELHGFVSQGFLLTTENNYLADSERGSFEFSEAALNASVALSDQLRVGMQLFTRDLGPIGDYKVLFDWFHLDYRFRDWLGFRAGRVKLPFGLYNDTSDVDAARNPVLLPQSIYPTQNRDFLLALTGAEVYGWVDLGAPGALEYRLDAGTIFLDFPEDPTGALTVVDLKIPYLVGGRLLWETPLPGLRLGGSVLAARLETTILAPMMAPADVELGAILWVASVEYNLEDLLAAVEYGRWHTDTESSNPMLVEEGTRVNERAYAMLAYRVNHWFQPGAYYSLYYPDVDDRSGRDAKQHDVALTLRWDVHPNWLVKLEGHYLHGTAALSSSQNDGLDRAELEPDWALFLLKTTAYF